jgi:hypothetical protein
MSMCAVSMPQKSCWDKLRGDSLRERVGNLGGDERSALGVTTLGGNGALVMLCVRIVVCDLVCSVEGMGEANIGEDDSASHGH